MASKRGKAKKAAQAVEGGAVAQATEVKTPFLEKYCVDHKEDGGFTVRMIEVGKLKRVSNEVCCIFALFLLSSLFFFFAHEHCEM